jgi:hypothetical protein
VATAFASPATVAHTSRARRWRTEMSSSQEAPRNVTLESTRVTAYGTQLTHQAVRTQVLSASPTHAGFRLPDYPENMTRT